MKHVSIYVYHPFLPWGFLITSWNSNWFFWPVCPSTKHLTKAKSALQCTPILREYKWPDTFLGLSAKIKNTIDRGHVWLSDPFHRMEMGDCIEKGKGFTTIMRRMEIYFFRLTMTMILRKGKGFTTIMWTVEVCFFRLTMFLLSSLLTINVPPLQFLQLVLASLSDHTF